MVKYIILLIFLITAYNANAQLTGKARIDSLEAELPNAKNDTNHVKILYQISFAYRGINPDKGIKFGEEGLKIAKDLEWKKGLANSYNSLAANYHIKSDYTKALEYYNKSLMINEELDNIKGIADNFVNIGVIYWNQSNATKALNYYSRALKIHEEIGDKSGIARNNVNIGNVYLDQSDYPKALEYYSKALVINEEQGDKRQIALNLGNIGALYFSQSDYPKALEYLAKSLKIHEELGNKRGIAGILVNIGSVYQKQSNYPKALEYFNKSLKINEEIGSKDGIATTLGNMGNIYLDQSEYLNALEYLGKALKIHEELSNKSGIATNLRNIGIVFWKQSDYLKALENFKKSLRLYEEIGNKAGMALSLESIGIIYAKLLDYLKAIENFKKSLKINEEIGNRRNIAFNLGNIGNLYLILSQDTVNIRPDESNQFVSLDKDINLNRSIEYLLEGIEIFDEIGELNGKSFFLGILAKAYNQRGDYKKAYEAHVEYKTLQDSVFNMDKAKKIATLTATREKEVAEKELEIQKLENIRRRNESYALYGGLALFAVVLFVIYRQRKRSEKLLLNILPAAIAKRLKAKEHPIADHFDNASVVFIDIVGFTKIASDRDSNQIVNSLNIIFTKFDEIAAKYKLEKIKTIGDSYMAVTGVPLPDPDHAKNMVKFALEVKAEMHNYRTEDDTLIQFRIGIDCGDVVAGVIGSNKFIYDLWGDTVNTASRMESNGTPDEIQVTERFKEALESDFEFVERGEISIKGKGMMKTYYLKGEKVD